MATLVSHQLVLQQEYSLPSSPSISSLSPASPMPPKGQCKRGTSSIVSNASTSSSSTSGDIGDLSRCKRRIAFGYGLSSAQTSIAPPATVARRNARERNRVKQVNLGFANLRQHIPMSGGKSKKISKVETLKCAVDYINNLQRLLNEHDALNLNGMVEAHQVQDSSYFPGSETGESSGMQTHSPCSEASSPTPSFDSERSNSYMTATTMPVPVYENYENYQPMSPEDEVLLDAISWWQQSQ